MASEITEFNYRTRFSSNEPGSITWLATMQLKNMLLVAKNHIEKLITMQPQNI